MIDQLSPATLAFYRRAMTTLDEAGVPFLVGGYRRRRAARRAARRLIA